MTPSRAPPCRVLDREGPAPASFVNAGASVANAGPWRPLEPVPWRIFCAARGRARSPRTLRARVEAARQRSWLPPLFPTCRGSKPQGLCVCVAQQSAPCALPGRRGGASYQGEAGGNVFKTPAVDSAVGKGGARRPIGMRQSRHCPKSKADQPLAVEVRRGGTRSTRGTSLASISVAPRLPAAPFRPCSLPPPSPPAPACPPTPT
jgi:hypothetical protein